MAIYWFSRWRLSAILNIQSLLASGGFVPWPQDPAVGSTPDLPLLPFKSHYIFDSSTAYMGLLRCAVIRNYRIITVPRVMGVYRGIDASTRVKCLQWQTFPCYHNTPLPRCDRRENLVRQREFLYQYCALRDGFAMRTRDENNAIWWNWRVCLSGWRRWWVVLHRRLQRVTTLDAQWTDSERQSTLSEDWPATSSTTQKLYSPAVFLLSSIVWRSLLPYAYSYKASCVRPGCAVICNFWHPCTLSARMSKNYKWRRNPVWHRLYPLWQQLASKVTTCSSTIAFVHEGCRRAERYFIDVCQSDDRRAASLIGSLTNSAISSIHIRLRLLKVTSANNSFVLTLNTSTSRHCTRYQKYHGRWSTSSDVRRGGVRYPSTAEWCLELAFLVVFLKIRDIIASNVAMSAVTPGGRGLKMRRTTEADK